MRRSWIAELQHACGDRVRLDEPLAPYTTYRIGGPADAFVEPAGPEDVRRALAVARRSEVPWIVLGLGSNVLIADAGFRGVVLRIGRALGTVRETADAWEVGAGFPTPLLARRSAAAGRSGVHRLVGVPGTVGGGVYMNAGAHGQEFRDVVQDVTLVTEDGVVEQRAGGAIPWAYRSSGLEHVVVIGARLRLEPDDRGRMQAEIEEHLRWRKAGTPFNEPCCGSVFRNPDAPVAGDGSRVLRTAGQLIDSAGLKGLRIGGAEVSPKHANYIVNAGGATATQVRAVIDTVRDRVRAAFGIELRLEVQLVGDWAGSCA